MGESRPYAILDAEATPSLAVNATAAEGNPLKGFLTSPEWSSWPYLQSVPSSLEYYYVPLRSVMNDNASDFSGFDTYLEPRLRASAARGMHSVLRFFLDYPGAADPLYAVPQFLIDGGLAFHNYTEFGGGRSPDYTSNALLAALEGFIAALGARYDGDPRLGFVQLGLLGFWAEWHTYPYDWIPDTSKDRVVAAFAGAFRSTQLQVRTPWASAVGRARFGLHDDSFAYSTLDGAYNGGSAVPWFFWPSVESAGWSHFWANGAMGGELRPELQSEVFQSNYPAGTAYKQDVVACVEVTHATYMLNFFAFSTG